jgi:hypothetical protein
MSALVRDPFRLEISENVVHYFEDAEHFYFEGCYEFDAVGQPGSVSIVENNMGSLSLVSSLMRRPKSTCFVVVDCSIIFPIFLMRSSERDISPPVYCKQHTLTQDVIEHALPLSLAGTVKRYWQTR